MGIHGCRSGTMEQAWRADPEPKLLQFVPTSNHLLRLPTLAELIKVDQEIRWRRGKPKKLEGYLDEWPELRDQPQLIAELLAAECLTQAVLDKKVPAVEELRSRFPAICGLIDLDVIEGEAQAKYWGAVQSSESRPGSDGFAETLDRPSLIHRMAIASRCPHCQGWSGL